ncbi:hypothetical protein BCR22_12870 [Enterococcus plantarum]|uniref:effector binding domain-containing protein n=1 Tax=Enterococcus plantarum TaxID=1077675 RepID=UPI00084DE723|nr:effector binding domain-containing protein [Enterococcus plantarum]MBO0422328.1 hypothetical protein [Enterococcus plantarum]OEG17692.1 hypothetical protein BCR22_12870 [Enterococcus plantarum]
MSFTIDYLNTEVITGKQYKFAIPKTPEDFIEVNNQKLEILPTDKKNVRAIIINDPDERNGTYNYFIEANEGNRTFTLESGDYAVFTGTWDTLADIDNFIGASYGELYQSPEYGIGGTHAIQLLDFDPKKIILKLPAIRK